MMTPFQLGRAVAHTNLDGALRRASGTGGAPGGTTDAPGHADRVEWRVPTEVLAVPGCREAPGGDWEDRAPFRATPGMTVSVVHPAQLQADAAARVTRTNPAAVDARLSAAGGAARQPPPWPARREAEVAWRALVLRLAALHTRRIQASPRWEVARDTVRPHRQAHLDWLAPQIETRTATLNPPRDSNPNLQGQRAVLDSMPGRGERTIALRRAFCAAPSRVANRRQAAAVGGLEPRQHPSGPRVKTQPRLSQSGHAVLRKALYRPAMVPLYKTAWGKPLKDRLARSGQPPTLLSGARRRTRLHVAFGVLPSGKKFDPALHDA